MNGFYFFFFFFLTIFFKFYFIFKLYKDFRYVLGKVQEVKLECV